MHDPLGHISNEHFIDLCRGAVPDDLFPRINNLLECLSERDILPQYLGEYIGELESNIGYLEVKVNDLEGEVSDLESDMAENEDCIDRQDKEIDDLRDENDRLNTRIAELESHIETREGQFAKFLSEMDGK